MEHFKSSFMVMGFGLVLALFIGGIKTLYIVSLLALLEVSLSFDNAVVNAKILEEMDKKWQDRFISIGMPIAVFGIRFIFPILIVSIASGIGVFDTLNLAINSPETYEIVLSSVEKLIYAFGGGFLLMVFLNFLFENDREHNWIELIEKSKTVKKMSELSTTQMIISILIGIILVVLTKEYSIALAYFSGILLYAIIGSFDKLFSVNGIRNGIMGLLYLEVLDASFSFDGVIGAFALSNNIFIIMIGLGIGAMFVRSLTLYMIKEKTLNEYRYLEHGAHYAILMLSIIMLSEIFIHINEIVIGAIGITFIAISAYHSIRENKKDIATLS
jgi:hypothetical protein